MNVEEYALTTHAGEILGECLGVLHCVLEEE